jgi:hypothetical protein
MSVGSDGPGGGQVRPSVGTFRVSMVDGRRRRESRFGQACYREWVAALSRLGRWRAE